MSIIEKLQQACTNFSNAIEKAEESLLKQDIAIKNSTVDRQHKINLSKASFRVHENGLLFCYALNDMLFVLCGIQCNNSIIKIKSVLLYIKNTTSDSLLFDHNIIDIYISYIEVYNEWELYITNPDMFEN